METRVLGAILLLGGLAAAQSQVPYREVAVPAVALACLQTVAAQVTQGDAKILGWAKEVKARAEKSYEEKAYFRAAREAHAAILLFRGGGGLGKDLKNRLVQRGKPMFHTFSRHEGARRGLLRVDFVDRAEKELAYYRARDPLARTLVEEAKARKEREPLRAQLLARAALSLISAERGF